MTELTLDDLDRISGGHHLFDPTGAAHLGEEVGKYFAAKDCNFEYWRTQRPPEVPSRGHQRLCEASMRQAHQERRLRGAVR